MYSDAVRLLGVGLMLQACGAPLTEPQVDQDLPALTFYSEASGAGMEISSTAMVFVDNRVDHLLRFEIDPFKFSHGIPLRLGENEAQWFLPASEGRYYVTVGKEDFAVVNNDGLQEKNPVSFDNDIQAAALSEDHDYLFLQDELGKIIIIGLSEAGEFENRYLGSATFGTDQAFVSGAMLTDGRFIASLGESTIGLVDMKETLKEQEWQLGTFEVPGATAMTWLAAVPGEEDQVLIKDANRIVLLDYASETVLDEIDISGKQDVRASRQGMPHIMAADNISSEKEASQPYQLYYAHNGEISAHVISNVKSNYSTSYLDQPNGTLVVTVNQLEKEESEKDENEVGSRFKGDVFRFEVENGVAIDKTNLKGSTRVGLTNKFVIQHFDSALGLVKRTKYGEEDQVETLKLFNIDLLRAKHD